MPIKVLLPVVMILAGIGWLAFTNLSEANYFYKVNELPPSGDKVYKANLRIKGRIVAGSIQAKQKPVAFTIEEGDKRLNIRYVGEEPLPDLFKDHAEAVVDGRMAADGVFEAEHLQAKCASKYEAMELQVQATPGATAPGAAAPGATAPGAVEGADANSAPAPAKSDAQSGYGTSAQSAGPLD